MSSEKLPVNPLAQAIADMLRVEAEGLIQSAVADFERRLRGRIGVAAVEIAKEYDLASDGRFLTIRVRLDTKP